MTTSTAPVRSQEEIVEQIHHLNDNEDDFFGHKRSDLLGYLDFEHAKQFLKPEATKDQWDFIPSDRESILKQMEEYMSFAWDKANNCRGLSAARSMDHYTAWIWMLNDDEHFDELDEYQFYGKDNLRKICDHYGWNADLWDDGTREN